MNKKQRENTAKYLYDISKIIFTLAILGNILAGEKFNVWVFWFGIMGAATSFVWAFSLDRKGE